MAKAAIPLLFLILFFISVGNLTMLKGEKTWCVAKPSSDDNILYSNIEFACGQKNVNCQPIGFGGPCYYPNTTINHASVAMNLYYQAYSYGGGSSTCYFANSGLISFTDPSYGDCKYP